jgi:undecaprenyl phosphate-alpha-L-ara4N flippase subunit ArnE
MTALSALWLSIAIGAVAQIALKYAVSAPRRDAGPADPMWWTRLLRSGWLWLYFASFGAATALWLLALAGLNISYAFPLLSMGYVLVAVLARIFLNEAVSARRWAAIGVICCGVILIARS